MSLSPLRIPSSFSGVISFLTPPTLQTPWITLAARGRLHVIEDVLPGFHAVMNRFSKPMPSAKSPSQRRWECSLEYSDQMVLRDCACSGTSTFMICSMPSA